MAGLNHEQLQQDMARALGRGMIRSGVKVMLDSNALGGEQLSPCPACHGEATTAESLPPTEKGMKESPVDLHDDQAIGKHLYDLACAVRYPGVEARGWDALGDKGRDEYVQIAVDFRALMRTLYVGNAGDVEGNGFVISDDGKVVNYLGENYYVHDDWNTARLAQLRLDEIAALFDATNLVWDEGTMLPQKVEAVLGWHESEKETVNTLRENLRQVRAMLTAETGAAVRNNGPLHEQVQKAIQFARHAATQVDAALAIQERDSWEAKYLEEDRLRKQAERTLGHVGTLLGIDADTKDIPNAVRKALAEAETRGRAKLVAEMNKIVTEERDEHERG